MTALSVDVVCAAIETVLTAQLPAALTAQGSMTEGGGLLPVLSWGQLPERTALFNAELPAGAITSPGVVGVPVRDENGSYRATWLVAVALYVRGIDHHDTTQRCRAYAAAIRDVLIANPSLAGVSQAVRWTHEEYALLDPRSARTEGGCLVEVEVDVQDVVTVGAGTAISEVTGTYLPIHPAL